MIDLVARPFELDDAGVSWVRDTLSTMATDEKVGQLFCLYLADAPTAAGQLARLDALGLRPGGFLTILPRPRSAICSLLGEVRSWCVIPPLVAANVEAGGSGVITEGTFFGSAMQVAATGDPEVAHRLGLVCGRESRAAGCNWAFAPVADLDLNPQNPVTRTRTFGSDPDLVSRMTRAYLAGLHASRVAGCAKHWPGDGLDDRDQHLLTSVNSLDAARWDDTYGRVYRSLIDAGVETIMAAHIRQPSWSRLLRPGIGDDAILPASLAPELLVDLLRGRLGFNGLVVTDNTAMTGMTSVMPRRLALPRAVAAGCDMILGTIDVTADFGYVLDAVHSGVITSSRLDDAVTRILALKAAIGLHSDPGTAVDQDGLASQQRLEHRAWVADAANRSATLVKDTQSLLPIDPVRYHRVLVHVVGDEPTFYDSSQGLGDRFIAALAERGFDVRRWDPPDPDADPPTPEEVAASCDLLVYFANVKFDGRQNASRLRWATRQGRDGPRFVYEVPTLFVSVNDPYHLQDVPMVRTYVNAYSPTDEVVRAVVERLVGEAPFVGTSPVDPFAGRWDARL